MGSALVRTLPSTLSENQEWCCWRGGLTVPALKRRLSITPGVVDDVRISLRTVPVSMARNLPCCVILGWHATVVQNNNMAKPTVHFIYMSFDLSKNGPPFT